MPVALLSSTLVHSVLGRIGSTIIIIKKKLKCLARSIFMPEVYLKSCGNNIISLKETVMLSFLKRGYLKCIIIWKNYLYNSNILNVF